MATRSTANHPVQGGFHDLGILAAIVVTFLIGMALGNAVRPVSISSWFDDDSATVSTTKPIAAHVPDLAGEGVIQAQQEGVAAVQSQPIERRQGPAALDDDPIVAHTPEFAGEGILQAQREGVAAPLPMDSYEAKLQRQQKLYTDNGQLYPPVVTTNATDTAAPFSDPMFMNQNLYLPGTTTTATENSVSPHDFRFIEENVYLPTSGSVNAGGGRLTGQLR
ncbi:MAG: hypothetical protein M9890_04540 [Thermomicrobiales bacterium]|nr:hypothetical protein [Thermomicrobiales bacterium]